MLTSGAQRPFWNFCFGNLLKSFFFGNFHMLFELVEFVGNLLESFGKLKKNFKNAKTPRFPKQIPEPKAQPPAL